MRAARGDSTFLEGRFEVLSAKGRSLEVRPLGCTDARRVIHVASDRVVSCKRFFAAAEIDDQGGAHDELVQDFFDIDLHPAVDDNDEDFLAAPVNQPADGPAFLPPSPQLAPAREGRVRRPPQRFGIDDFIYGD